MNAKQLLRMLEQYDVTDIIHPEQRTLFHSNIQQLKELQKIIPTATKLVQEKVPFLQFQDYPDFKLFLTDEFDQVIVSSPTKEFILNLGDKDFGSLLIKKIKATYA